VRLVVQDSWWRWQPWFIVSLWKFYAVMATVGVEVAEDVGCDDVFVVGGRSVGAVGSV
jgi:hypothetical protein